MKPLENWKLKRMARKSTGREPQELQEASGPKRYEVALRLAQVFAAWAQVVGVAFAALAAVYAINNNLLSIKNSELEERNRVLSEKNTHLESEVGAREEELSRLEGNLEVLSQSAQTAKSEAERLQILAKRSEEAERRSRETLEQAYFRTLSEHIHLQAVGDELRRVMALTSEQESQDSEGIYFDAKSPRNSTLMVPDFVAKYLEIIGRVREDPTSLGMEKDSESFRKALARIEAEFEKHKALLVCEEPDRAAWIAAFERELSREKRMMDIAGDAKFQSHVAANSWSERQRQAARRSDWWREEEKSVRKLAGDFWRSAVVSHYYSEWWRTFSACKFNFEQLSRISIGKLQPRAPRGGDLSPPAPLKDQQWGSIGQ